MHSDRAGADFPQLYLQLGVDADCSLDEFKHACRRRIGNLHPDRRAGHSAAPAGEIGLDELLALYGRALRFHHRHGRLPGAVSRRRPHVTDSARAAATPPACRDPPCVPDNAPAPMFARTPLHRVPMLALAAGIGVLATLAWPGRDVATSAAEASGRDVAAGQDTGRNPDAETDVVKGDGAGALPRHLAVGMDPVTALALQGEPLRVDGSRWEYGPSWLRFEDGRLVEWYSSPLHPLRAGDEPPR